VLATIRQSEVEAQALLEKHANEAVTKFEAALQLTGDDPLVTYRASLYTQLAKAYRLAQRPEDATKALVKARRLVRDEEKRALAARRTREPSDDLWRTYFSRFTETYQSLIQQYADDHQDDQAFLAAEEVRGLEPLDLILALPNLPRAFRTLVAQPDSRSVVKLQALLPAGKVVLFFSVQEDQTYTWVLSRTTFHMLPQPVGRADIERWASALQEAAKVKNPITTFAAPLRDPYQRLFAHPLSWLRANHIDASQLVIVPDGAMHSIPFAALQDGSTYLLEHASIEVSESVLLYLASVLLDEQAPRQQPSVFLVGNPTFDPSFSAQLRPLPAAEAEVQEIAALYGAAAKRPLVGTEATVERFMAMAPRSTIVHVAAHAIVNTQSPEKSVLLLAKDGQQNGALYANDLLARVPRLPQTRLVVLAACSTAGGLPIGSGGLAPLVRPLMTAGVPAVIGTLWQVDDPTIKDLMVSFHREYRQGRDAAAALQAAQRKALKKDRSPAAVLTWGAFQVIGHASSPFASPHENDKGEPP
jgi:CHAT domain-containing protein